MNRNSVAATVSNIGCQLGDGSFMLNEEAHECLQSVWTLLCNEDPALLNIRRHLGALSFGPKILIPLIQNIYDDCNDEVEERDTVFLTACKFLVALTEPLSVLMTLPASVFQQQQEQQQQQQDHGLQEAAEQTAAAGRTAGGVCTALVMDMERILQEIRTEFLKPAIHTALFSAIISMLKKCEAGSLSADEISLVNCMFYLYRNLLSSRKRPGENLLIVGLMFQGGFQECCHLIFSRPEMSIWVVAFIQLLPIIYCNECDLLEDDEESEQCKNGSKTLVDKLSDDLLTTSPSPHNMSISPPLSSVNMEGTIKSSNHNLTNSCLLATAAARANDGRVGGGGGENGTGANGCVGGASDRESTGATGNVGGMLSSVGGDLSTDRAEATMGAPRKMSDVLFSKNFEEMDDSMVDNLMILLTRKNLRTLAEDFIDNAFSDLLYVLKGHVLCGNLSNPSSTYIGWAIYYFLSLCRALKVPVSKLKEVVSFDMVGFLVYQICMLQESIIGRKKEECEDVIVELEWCMKGVMAVVDYIITFAHDKPAQDAEYIRLVKLYMIDMMNLSEMLIFVLRHCPSGSKSKLLCDTILLNHKFLLMAESLTKESCSFDFNRHIEHFATRELMLKLFSAVEVTSDGRFGSSSELVSAVFTMAYHVIADHSRLDCIAQVPILSTLCSLDDDRLLNALSLEHIDLVNYIMRQIFGEVDDDLLEKIKAFDRGVVAMDEQQAKEEDEAEVDQKREEEWSEEEVSIVMDAYMQHSNVKDFLHMLRSHDALNNKSPFQVLYKLLSMEMLNEEEFQQALVDCNDPAVMLELSAFIGRHEQQEQQQQQQEQDEEPVVQEDTAPQQLENIIAEIQQICSQREIQWLQQQLVEACFVLCGGRDLGKSYAEEPLYLYRCLSGQSFVLPVLTEHEEKLLARPVVKRLLLLMGCDLSDSTVFPRLPLQVNVFHLFTLAKKLANMDNVIEKVEEADLIEANLRKVRFSEEEKAHTDISSSSCSSSSYVTMSGSGSNKDKTCQQSNNIWPQIVFMFNNAVNVS